MGATSNGCEICGRLLPPVRFTETETYSYLCQDCADTEDVRGWRDVIPVCGEVSPAECTDYPTHSAQVAADEAEAEDAHRPTSTEADLCECGHLVEMHAKKGCHGWKDGGFCSCTQTYTTSSIIRQRRSGQARLDAARARRTAAAIFNADNGRAEWQPSAEAKQLIKELQGGLS